MKKQSFCHLGSTFDIEKMSLQNPYACAVCKMAFSTPKYLHTHVQLTHFSANVFPKTISKNGGKTIDMTVGTENVYNSEKLLIKENENSDGNIKTLDKVVIQDLLKKQVTSILEKIWVCTPNSTAPEAWYENPYENSFL